MDSGQKPCVDFKMNSFKSKVCTWLHVAWMKVKGYDEHDCEGMGQDMIHKNIQTRFQLDALEANVLTPLFTIIKTLGNKWKKMDDDPTLLASTIMEKCM
jgi:fatty-acid desaturase